MVRQSLTQEQIKNNELTGADFNRKIGIYDETYSYAINDVVIWNTKFYIAIGITPINPEGDLSNSPENDTTNWKVNFKDADGQLLASSDYIPTEPKSLITKDYLEDYAFTETEHENLYILAHNLNMSRYDEYIRTGGLVSSIITWTDSGKTQKIKEEIYTRTAGLVTEIVTRQYNAFGVLSKTQTETIARSSGVVTNSIIGVA